MDKSWVKYEVPGLTPNIATPWMNADDSTDTSETKFDNITEEDGLILDVRSTWDVAATQSTAKEPPIEVTDYFKDEEFAAKKAGIWNEAPSLLEEIQG